jgi:amidase
MISPSEYLRHDAISLAELVKRRELSASELLEAAIAQSEAVNPRLNALTIPMFELARARAKSQLEGPLAGVPFLIKDLFQDYAGVLASSGSASGRRAQYTPAQHAEIVQRWLSAGLVIFGRTNTPEFGAKGITEPDAWGATRNPWDLTRSPGGSSGGAAAAVAAGIVPVAGASDGGGSIRIPAASTGLFGLKPGRGRTPSGPWLGEAMHGAAMNHVISRSVRDSACLLDATHGPERGSLCKLAAPPRPYLAEVERVPGRLRIAFSARSPLGTEVDPAASSALEQTARLLEQLGHDVEPGEPDIDGLALARDFLAIWFAHLAVHMKHAREQLGARDADFELDSLAMEAIARVQRATDYVESYLRWNHYGCQLSEFLARYDVYMTPALALPPPRIGAVHTPTWAANLMRAGMPLGLSRLIPLAKDTIAQATLENLRGVPFTQLANVTGVPAMSVPLATFANGLPLGIQFVSDHGAEGLLLSLAAQLEQASPWQQRRPAL